MNLTYQIKEDSWFLIENRQEQELMGNTSFLMNLLHQIGATKANVDVSSYVAKLASYMKSTEVNLSNIGGLYIGHSNEEVKEKEEDLVNLNNVVEKVKNLYYCRVSPNWRQVNLISFLNKHLLALFQLH